MSLGWDRLPVVPLLNVLEHLGTKDAISTMSVCRNWRTAIHFYEGRKSLLQLYANQPDRTEFLARMFRRNACSLHVYLNGTQQEIDRFFDEGLPEFFHSNSLSQLIIIGPNYLQRNQPPTKIRRIVTEGLLVKNKHFLTTLTMLGCEMDLVDPNDRFIVQTLPDGKLKFTMAPLKFASGAPYAGDSIFTAKNYDILLTSRLHFISVDYDQINTESLKTLSNLLYLHRLSVTIANGDHLKLDPIDWAELVPFYPNGLDVAVNIVEVPVRVLNKVIKNVLTEGLRLIEIKVLFCNTLYMPLVLHLIRRYKSCLREVVWADAPLDLKAQPAVRLERVTRAPAKAGAVRAAPQARRAPGALETNVNPFIMLCWQCPNLTRLVVHGYWIWQYDILGCVRLRNTLCEIEISAICNNQSRLTGSKFASDGAVRVTTADKPTAIDRKFIKEMNSYTMLWRPMLWKSLPAALTARRTPANQASYVLHEIAGTKY